MTWDVCECRARFWHSKVCYNGWRNTCSCTGSVLQWEKQAPYGCSCCRHKRKGNPKYGGGKRSGWMYRPCVRDRIDANRATREQLRAIQAGLDPLDAEGSHPPRGMMQWRHRRW